MAQNETILLIDDDDNDRLLIQRAFQKAGLKSFLRTVADGREALDYLQCSGKYADRTRYPVPFLALLDLKMPGMAGFEVLQWIRSQPNLRRLLVVVLTSSSLQSDVDRAYELGANSYLVKPVEFEEMVSMVLRFETYWTEINRVPSSPTDSKPVNPQTTLD
jgi:CheY-like chemotaxis protein